MHYFCLVSRLDVEPQRARFHSSAAVELLFVVVS